MIKHCVSTFLRETREKIYRAYIADTLKCLNDTMASAYSGMVIKDRYSEIIGDIIKDEKTGDEIAEDIIVRAGLKVS